MTQGLIVATVVSKASIQQSQNPIQIALFKADGTPYPIISQMPVQAASVAADVATLKTDFNALLTKLKNAGLMAAA